MKPHYGVVLISAAVFLGAFLSGCSGFWDALSSISSTTTTTDSSGDFYVVNQKTNQIVAYWISSGKLDEITAGTGAPNPTSFTGTANCIAIAPGGGYLYLGTTSGIYAYQIESGGALRPLNSGATLNGISDQPLAMQVAYDGVTGNTWLIDAFPASTSGSNTQVTVHAIPLNSSGLFNNGDAVPSQPVSAADSTVFQLAVTPGAVASSPNTGYILLAMGNGGAVAIPFNGDSATPFSTPQPLINPISTQSVLSVAVDPSQRLFYIGQTDAVSGSGGLLVYNYSALGSGSNPTPLSSLASGGPSPYAILPESTGSYIYVANANGNSNGTINWFTITPTTSSGTTTYQVAAGSSIQSGIMPRGLAEDSSDQFILAASFGEGTGIGGDPDLEAFTMSSGALVSAVVSSTGNSGSDPVDAIAIAAQP